MLQTDLETAIDFTTESSSVDYKSSFDINSPEINIEEEIRPLVHLGVELLNVGVGVFGREWTEKPGMGCTDIS
jgi:hypothetical protein